MADQRRPQLPDGELIVALGGLAETLAWPVPALSPDGPDLATRVRARIVAAPPARARRQRWSWWPARRALVLAGAALLALAAVATAVGLGVPGIRLIFGEPPVTAPPSAQVSPSASTPAGPPGSDLALGGLVTLEDVEARAGFPVRLPSDPTIPPPAAVYVNALDQVALVWAPSDVLPPTAEPRVGMLINQFEGRIHPESMTKFISQGTSVEPVTVDGQDGYWISGDAHFYFYEGPDGEFIEDVRRWVGDALIWTDGEITYRLETSLGRDAAIRIAESLE
jgi:hypothetical protein